MNTPARSEPDEQRDAHLRAALRHAPDAGAQPPAHLDAAIRRDAHAAVGRGRTSAGSSRVVRLLHESIGWLAHPARSAALASLVLATTVTLMWRDQPIPEAVAPPAGSIAPATPAAALPTTPTPTPAAAPVQTPSAPTTSGAARSPLVAPTPPRPAAKATAERALLESAPAPAPAARIAPSPPDASVPAEAADPKSMEVSTAQAAPPPAAPATATSPPTAPDGVRSPPPVARRAPPRPEALSAPADVAPPPGPAPAPAAMAQAMSPPQRATLSERRGFRPSGARPQPELPAQLAAALRDERTTADTGSPVAAAAPTLAPGAALAVLDWQPVAADLTPQVGDIVLRTAGGLVEGHVRLDGDALLWRPLAPGPAFRLVLDAATRARLARRWADAERVPP